MRNDSFGNDLLLGARWAPVTECVLFVRASPDRAAEALLRGVRAQHVLATTGEAFVKRSVVEPSLDSLFRSLLPLESPIGRRQVFVPTSNPEWCAMFTSHWRGLNPNGFMYELTQHGLDSASITDVPHMRADRMNGSYGIRRIAMESVQVQGDRIRHLLGVRAASDRKWELDLGRSEFPGGNVWNPAARRISDKFTHAHLVEMAARIGLRPFDEDFYRPGDGSTMVVDTTLVPGPWIFATLEQARGESPMPDHVVVP